LNKRDAFRTKFLVDKVPLNVSGCFPHAPTQTDDVHAAVDWMKQEFLQRRVNSRREVIVRITSASSQGEVCEAFDTVCSVLNNRRTSRD